ncbi:MAG: IS110 family transposase [Chloroflexi bacterium]|nr:MAG: IS110 family transposase [Chloroflexota bacterium]
MRCLGVDLHKRQFHVCYLSEGSCEHREFMMEELPVFLSTLEMEDQVAVEATGNTHYFVNEIESYVSKVIVVNPRQFRVIEDSIKKTDYNDAELLARFLSFDGLLPEVKLPQKEASQIKSLAHTRNKLVQLRTALKNKIHGIMTFHGILLKREALSSDKGLDRALSAAGLSASARFEVEILVEQIRSLNASIKKIDAELEDRGRKLKGHRNITSIKGVGDKSASILLSVIGDINNFPSRKQLDSYFGIVPKVRNSGDTVRHGHISKQGSKLGRTTLVQCTLIAIRYSPYLRSYYERLKSKKGSGKAIIATARKLLGTIYMLLSEDLIFEDFESGVLVKATHS